MFKNFNNVIVMIILIIKNYKVLISVYVVNVKVLKASVTIVNQELIKFKLV